MVEKSKPQGGLQKPSPGQQKRASGGILKKVAKSLDAVPEYGQSQMQRADSTAESSTAEKIQVSEEEEKFKTLCAGVQNLLALFQVSMTELLALKDELIKHALPPSLLVKFTLVTSKLFRGASDLAVPVNELVRLVKLYSAPWEAKSAALKKLHEDYENKQRQLNVALQKLVVVGIQSERMAQERRILNWEKLFTRIMTSNAHGYRWKFLIDSFKKKIKTGEVYEAGTSTDEETERGKAKSTRQLEIIRRKTMGKETTAKRIMRETVTMEDAKKSVTTPLLGTQKKSDDKNEESSVDEEFSDLELSSVKDFDDDDRTRKESAERRGPSLSPQFNLPPKKEKERPKISFSFNPPSDDDDDSDEDEKMTGKSSLFPFKPARQANKKTTGPKIQFAEEKLKARPKPKFRGVKFFDPSDDEEDEKVEQKNAVAPKPEPPKTEEKDCWTHEPDYEKFLHVRVFRPVCMKAEAPSCSVVFMGVALKTATYELPSPPPSPPDTPVENTNKAGVMKRVDVKTKDAKGGITSRSASGAQTPGSHRQSDVHEQAAEVADSTPPEEDYSRFEELLFKLPDDNGYSPGEKRINLSQEQIKVAVHPSPEQPMVAMAAIAYGDLKILDQFDGRWSHTDYSDKIQEFHLISTMSDREMPFGSNCGHIPMVCYMSKTERPKTMTRETETLSFEELVRNEIQERRKAEEAEREEAMRGVSPMCYTELEVQSLRAAHVEEVQALHQEYERRLNELAQGIDAYKGNEEEMREFVHAATSPLHWRTPSPLRPHTATDQPRTPKPPSEARASSSRVKSRTKIPNLPLWGKDLPQDFLVRLNMFNENSEKYRMELEEKTKRSIQQKYELQMAVQNRLSIPEDMENPQEAPQGLQDLRSSYIIRQLQNERKLGPTCDRKACMDCLAGHIRHILQCSKDSQVCLPAVFMPTRTGLVFTPKAHSYFHPPGSSEGRLTQPPSVFKLPHVGVSSQVSVLNLFDMGQRYTGPPSAMPENGYTLAMAHPSQTAPPPPTACDINSPQNYPGRACTQ